MDKKKKLEILDLMITARCMEERMVKMAKTADAYFWLGGIGEEAFNVPFGLLAKRFDQEKVEENKRLEYDYFHFHYRNGATMVAMGMDPIDQLRQTHNRATDPYSYGRNFCNHYAFKPWNVVPTSSTIQTQCSIAPGTARAQKRYHKQHNKPPAQRGITFVTFGDAGTAEADFHVGLNWATLPDWELPLLFICTNNKYGISTPYADVHGQTNLTELAAGYGMKTGLADGNDPEDSWNKLKAAIDYVRKEYKPYFLEASVSRLHGHSSSSGGNRIPEGREIDPLHRWRDRLIEEKLITEDAFKAKYAAGTQRMLDLLARVKKEPGPAPESIHEHIFAKTE